MTLLLVSFLGVVVDVILIYPTRNPTECTRNILLDPALLMQSSAAGIFIKASSTVYSNQERCIWATLNWSYSPKSMMRWLMGHNQARVR
jgi:hypothetical protein